MDIWKKSCARHSFVLYKPGLLLRSVGDNPTLFQIYLVTLRVAIAWACYPAPIGTLKPQPDAIVPYFDGFVNYLNFCVDILKLTKPRSHV